MSQTNFTFTTMQILYRIANWDLEPFTLEELNFLLQQFLPATPVANWYYGEPSIDSLILETLSQLNN